MSKGRIVRAKRAHGRFETLREGARRLTVPCDEGLAEADAGRPTMGPPCAGRQHLPQPVDPHGQDGHPSVNRDEPDARLERCHLASSAAGSLGKDDDAPAVGEQTLNGTDGLGAATDPRKGTAANHDTTRRYVRRWNQ